MPIAPARPKRWSGTIATPGTAAHGTGCAATCSSISASGRPRQRTTWRSRSMTRGSWWRPSTGFRAGSLSRSSPNLSVCLHARPRSRFGLINPVSSVVSETVLTSRDWDEVLRRLAEQPNARLCAEGQMTDAVLADVAAIESITELDLSASHELTDEGLRHLAKLPRLRALNLSKTSITDHGLRVLTRSAGARVVVGLVDPHHG